MKLRQKVILFAVIPLLVVSIIIAVRVHRHSVLLAGQLRQVIKTAYLASKDEELKNYVAWQNVQLRTSTNLVGRMRRKGESESHIGETRLWPGRYFFYLA